MVIVTLTPAAAAGLETLAIRFGMTAQQTAEALVVAGLQREGLLTIDGVAPVTP